MENSPTAAGEAPQAPQTEATPTPTTNPEPAQAPVQSPNLHGFTESQLAEMEKFYSANGGYEKAFSKVKSAISNPQPSEAPTLVSEPQKQESSAPQPQQPEPVYQTPKGAITLQEFMAEQYFRSLAGEEKYANIADGVRNGDYLKEMSAFGIQPLNPDGSINDRRVRMYLDLKSQTVPAKPTETTPDASAAPTVTYTEVGEGGITSADQAYKILMEPGNQNMKAAEDFLRNMYNPGSSASKKS